VTVTNHLT